MRIEFYLMTVYTWAVELRVCGDGQTALNRVMRYAMSQERRVNICSSRNDTDDFKSQYEALREAIRNSSLHFARNYALTMITSVKKKFVQRQSYD